MGIGIVPKLETPKLRQTLNALSPLATLKAVSEPSATAKREITGERGMLSSMIGVIVEDANGSI